MIPAGSSAAFDSFNEIATVRIELRDTDPVIWRQVEVPTSITLKVLHYIIQAAMGWFDYHLWEFTIDKRRYGLPTGEDWGTEPRTDAAKVRLRDVLRPRKTTIDYLYDFGDCWEHRLTVTVEDHFGSGGLSSIVAEVLLRRRMTGNVHAIHLGERWFQPALLPAVLENEGFTGPRLAARILEALTPRPPLPPPSRQPGEGENAQVLEIIHD